MLPVKIILESGEKLAIISTDINDPKITAKSPVKEIANKAISIPVGTT